MRLYVPQARLVTFLEPHVNDTLRTGPGAENRRNVIHCHVISGYGIQNA